MGVRGAPLLSEIWAGVNAGMGGLSGEHCWSVTVSGRSAARVRVLPGGSEDEVLALMSGIAAHIGPVCDHLGPVCGHG